MIKHLIRRCLKKLGLKLVRIESEHSYYINAAKTIRAARENNISIREYVERKWDQEGRTESIINEMKMNSCFEQCNRVCEIGPGTGYYLELVIKHATVQQYDIYEIADDWGEYLAKTYGPTVVRQPTDGHNLSHTPDGSCDLVHAHGVFVYLSLLNSYKYFFEMIRVCSPEGYIVFDFFSDIYFDMKIITEWLKFTERYPVVLDSSKVYDCFKSHGFKLVHEFRNKYGHSYSDYVIFRRKK